MVREVQRLEGELSCSNICKAPSGGPCLLRFVEPHRMLSALHNVANITTKITKQYNREKVRGQEENGIKL